MAYLIYNVNGEPRRHSLTDDDTTIGRSRSCTLPLRHDHEISRFHCSIQRRDADSYVVIDTASKNGTFLNRSRIINEEKPLAEGDVIQVGRTQLAFHLLEPEQSTTAAFEEIAQEMEQGKGFQTIFREIVDRKPRG
jgi:pSer/pThr/pTyr-binding forkhead associated (FHA) protein